LLKFMTRQTGGLGLGRDLDQVEPALVGVVLREADRLDAELLPVLVDQPYFSDADGVVDARARLVVAPEPVSRRKRSTHTKRGSPQRALSISLL
jgi:hypothetical protein